MSQQQAVRHSKAVHYPTMMVTGIVASLALIGSYKFLYKPWAEKKRRLEAETMANTVYEYRAAQRKPNE